jgi:hypothetical protein
MGLFRRNRDADVVIDLREPAPAEPPSQWGSPVSCPSCDGRGYLEHIDPFKEIMYLHCTQCGVKYDVYKRNPDQITA